MTSEMTLKSELLPHQKEAVNKLKGLKVGALFMEQGTGKTITALELARIRYVAGKISAVIWLCPCSAKENIKWEILKQCPSELAKIITICGIETLSSSVRANAYLWNYVQKKRCFLVVDESLLVKNPKAYRTRNIIRISEKSAYKLILNGTPVSRNEADLFAQFYILDWRILGYRSFWSFAANHLEYDEYGRVRRALHTDRLAEKISPYTYQVLKEDCIQLPKKCYQRECFDMTHEQDVEYDRVAETLLMEVDECESETIYRLFSALQAVMSGKKVIFKSKEHFETAEMFDDPMDNPRIQALFDILPKDEKAIIFCRYQSEIDQICSILPGAVRFDGKVKKKDRGKAIEQFRDKGQYLIGNKNCAGFSLNLQFCRNIIYLSHDWELGKRLQSEDRVHRYGQEKEVVITDIYARNSLDERILSCLSRKEGILGSLQSEIEHSGKNKKQDVLKKFIYGRRYSKDIFDCSELEDDDNAEGVS